MTRITNADHVLLLLRNHLERMQKQRRKRGKAEVPEEKPAHSSQLERVARLATAEGVSEHEYQQALMAGLLADELGEAVSNDAKFTQLVDDVLAIIKRDPESSALLRVAQQSLSSS